MSETELLGKMLQQLEIALGDATLQRLLWFRDELLRWNKRINLTSITDPSEALEKHLVDSLTLLPYVRETDSLLDMGSGGGFPGIPLKIAQPSLHIWSVDAVSKKIAFQRHVARALAFDHFRTVHARLEDLADDSQFPKFNRILARAFAPLEKIGLLAKPLLAPEGEIIAMKGADALQELAEATKYLTTQGLECKRTVSFELPSSKAQRVLLFLGSKEKG